LSRKYKFLNPDGVYFVTLTVIQWLDVFTKRRYKDLIVDNLKYCQKNKGLVIHAWVIMTNHIHMIISRAQDKKCEEILRDFKKFTAFKLIGDIMANTDDGRKDYLLGKFQESGSHNSNNTKYQFWIQDNHPVELISNAMFDQKLDYLHNNPVEAGFVDIPEHYLYSSAIDYADGKGLIDIVLIS
jgi:REP element-mobilizing transposase RayT